MPRYFLNNTQQGRKSCFFLFHKVLLTLLLLSLPVVTVAEEGSTDQQVLISGLSASPKGKNLDISIHCSGMADYIPIELTKPAKIVIDIADAAISPGANLVLSPESYGIEVDSKLIEDVSPELVRVEFTLPTKYNYKLKWKGTDLILALENYFAEEQSPEDKSPIQPDPIVEEQGAPVSSQSAPLASGEKKDDVAKKESIDNHLPDMADVLSSVTGADTGGIKGEKSGKSARIGVADDDETITVDFYKIDLHNVFRMLREITGRNIVIAEGVSGTLTLALTDVPWQFALDIILNLKDLAKMERDNTIVIYPKDKEFFWPENKEDAISVEIDDDIVSSQEAIVIKQEKEVSPERIEAKKLIASGRAAEKKGDLETAMRFYEKALQKWPENTKLATKISTTYLAKLNQNAKAVFYAKKALKADKKNNAAALNAAIGYANMDENRQAQQYFDQSVNIGKPSREALISYAAFSERQRQYDAALRLLEKLEELYGQDLNSMVAQARIYDSRGEYGIAQKKYMAILNAGFRVPPDLKKFILSKTGRN